MISGTLGVDVTDFHNKTYFSLSKRHYLSDFHSMKILCVLCVYTMSSSKPDNVDFLCVYCRLRKSKAELLVSIQWKHCTWLGLPQKGFHLQTEIPWTYGLMELSLDVSEMLKCVKLLR